jgi:ribonuclease HI
MIVVYTDGSRDDKGCTGAGWILYQKQQTPLNTIVNGPCNLGLRSEVFDAELHASYESLTYLISSSLKPSQIYVCIDSKSTIDILKHNPRGIEGANRSQNAAQILRINGWLINTVWVPSHSGISGNEKADILGKAGTHATTPICKDTFTSLAWLTRWAHEQFLQKWQIASDTSSISWKYPDEWKGWTFHYAEAIFSAFAGRTATDPRFNEDPTPCKCGHPDLSSRHIIEQCPIFDQRRQKYGTSMQPL